MTESVRERSQQAVDALTQADDHLAFARTVLSGGLVTPDRKAGYEARIAAITARLIDPCQYLAVLGEFNSGKTTFVNALIGDALLTAHPWPTTAAVTRLRAGARPELRCRFHQEDREYTFPGTGRDALAAAVRRHLGPLADSDPTNVAQMLELLTADGRIAGAVQSVTVSHPAEPLAGGLVVIDTPGTNAHAGHTEIARRVIADEADAAVVVMAADDPLPESLAAFLQSALDPRMLRRCVFVVTKMATVDEAEREDLLLTVGSRIRSKLGIDDAIVLPVSVGVVVRDIRGRPPSDDGRLWIARFRATRTELISILDRRRAAAVSDRVLTLLDDLLGTLREDLDAERAAVGREQRDLASSGLADLDDFTAVRRADADTRVTRRVSGARTTMGSRLDEFERALVDAAVAAVPGDSTGRRQRIDDAVAEHLATLQQRCRAELVSVARSAAETAHEVDRAFAAGYRRLGALAPAAAPAPTTASLDIAAIDGDALKGVTELSARHESTENVLMGTGAAAGALVGTMIAPGIGTVLGAMLGSGTLLVGSAKREQAMCEQLRASMATLASSTRDEVLRQLDRTGSECATAVARRIDTVHRHYEPLVRDAQRSHELRRRALRDRERTLDSVLTELGRRENHLAAQRRRPSGTGGR